MQVEKEKILAMLKLTNLEKPKDFSAKFSEIMKVKIAEKYKEYVK